MKPRLTYLPIAYLEDSKSGILISDTYFKGSKRITNMSAEQVSENLIQIRYLDEHWDFLDYPIVNSEYFEYNMAEDILPEFTEEVTFKVSSDWWFGFPKEKKIKVHIKGWAKLKGQVLNKIIHTNNWTIITSDSIVKHIL